MITIDFSHRGTKSLTEYLCLQMKERILDGTLRGGERLPSKRSLAAHLGLSVITVQNAYEQLISEGCVYSAEKKGYFVTPPELNFLAADEGAEAGAEEVADRNPGAAEIDLRGNSTSPQQFPFSIWSGLVRQSLRESREKILAPLPPQGLFELRDAIAGHLARFRNMSVPPEQIVVGAGTEYLYGLIVQLLGRGLRYGVENPGHTKTGAILRSNGAECVPAGMDSSGILPGQLDSLGIDAVHVSPAHHFPTGTIMPVKRRQELLDWARGGNRFIIEDDYDSEFRFDGRPLDTLFSTDTGSRVIYLNTFTKTISPSLRISYMVLPAGTAAEFRRRLGFYSCTVSSIEQLTLARFIGGGFFGRHLVRMRNYYRNLRNALITELERSRLGPRMTILEADAGLHFLLRLDTDTDDGTLAARAREAGVRIALLSEYRHGSGCADEARDKAGTLVVNYSALRREQVSAAVEALCKVACQD